MTTPNNPEHQNQNASAHTTTPTNTPSDSTDPPATDAPAGQAAGARRSVDWLTIALIVGAIGLGLICCVDW